VPEETTASLHAFAVSSSAVAPAVSATGECDATMRHELARWLSEIFEAKRSEVLWALQQVYGSGLPTSWLRERLEAGQLQPADLKLDPGADGARHAALEAALAALRDVVAMQEMHSTLEVPEASNAADAPPVALAEFLDLAMTRWLQRRLPQLVVMYDRLRREGKLDVLAERWRLDAIVDGRTSTSVEESGEV
jgi:hypothetical protein